MRNAKFWIVHGWWLLYIELISGAGGENEGNIFQRLRCNQLFHLDFQIFVECEAGCTIRFVGVPVLI